MAERDEKGRFIKGSISAFKGRSHTEKSRRLISEVQKGIHHSLSTEFKKGMTPWNNGIKGIHISPSTEFKKGQIGFWHDKKRPDISDENHGMWKGNDAGYIALHSWVERKLGKSKRCEKCGTTEAKRFEWHNISGEYKRELSDWMRLCRSCHIKIERYNKNNRQKNGISEKVIPLTQFI